MRIRVSDKNLGQIIVDSNKDIGKVEEYAIKSLCMLQLMCLNTDSSDPRFREFIRILKDTTGKLDKLYNDRGDEDVDPFEQFNTSNI
jgi:hypothetical protein